MLVIYILVCCTVDSLVTYIGGCCGRKGRIIWTDVVGGDEEK